VFVRVPDSNFIVVSELVITAAIAHDNVSYFVVQICATYSPTFTPNVQSPLLFGMYPSAQYSSATELENVHHDMNFSIFVLYPESFNVMPEVDHLKSHDVILTVGLGCATHCGFLILIP
jgi:hypothetical protein